MHESMASCWLLTPAGTASLLKLLGRLPLATIWHFFKSAECWVKDDAKINYWPKRYAIQKNHWLGRAWASPTLVWLNCKTHVRYVRYVWPYTENLNWMTNTNYGTHTFQIYTRVKALMFSSLWSLASPSVCVAVVAFLTALIEQILRLSMSMTKH